MLKILLTFSLPLLVAACSPNKSNEPASFSTATVKKSKTSPSLSVLPKLKSSLSEPLTPSLGYPDFTALIEQQGPKVVHVRAIQKDPFTEKDIEDANDLIKKFFPINPDNNEEPKSTVPDLTPKGPSSGIGSGFFISADGYLLTNAHVVDKADSVSIKTSDRKNYSAKVVGIDTRTDVALLKIEGGPFPFVSTMSTEKLKVGSWVAAIGSPFGFDNSITAGIVSAKGRFLPDDNYLPFVQTDVPINPGNSGGPLFSLNGDVVAINTQIYSRTGGFMGMSFSIPIEAALTVADQLRSKGKVSRSRIGVRIQEISSDLATAMNLTTSEGAIVAFVDEDSPAQKAGLRVGDIITEANHSHIVVPAELTKIAAETAPGQPVVLGIVRDNMKREVTIKVVDAEAFISKKNKDATPIKPLAASNTLGLTFKGSSLMVEKSNGPALSAGIVKGDVILRVQNKIIKTQLELSNWLAANSGVDHVVVLVQRDNDYVYRVLELKR